MERSRECTEPGGADERRKLTVCDRSAPLICSGYHGPGPGLGRSSGPVQGSGTAGHSTTRASDSPDYDLKKTEQPLRAVIED
ncbi:hypothetical protein INR49_008045 [Caranx melampygus]|nr:hypothetical protein INR49_008045 [Caranx melampygus]